MIFSYYFGPFKIGNIYSSKFRKDKNPSTGFYISSSGKLIYNDLRTGEKLDCFAFVQKLFGIDFNGCKLRIATDFGLLGSEMSVEAQEAVQVAYDLDTTYKKETKIQFLSQKWNTEALAFWKDYHITKEELKHEGVYFIKDLFVNGRKIANRTDSLRFALTAEYKGEELTKVYSIGSEDTLKWMSNIPLFVPFGLKTLNKQSDTCFTGKAVKDMIIIKKFLPSVLASQNESPSSLIKVKKNLLSTFKFNYLGWDNDETGLQGMDIMKEEGFIPWHVKIELFDKGIKDISDLAKYKGLKAVEQFLKPLL